MECHDEIHALRKFQNAVAAKSANAESFMSQFLTTLQWGEKLWRAQARLAACQLINPDTSPAAAAMRQPFFVQWLQLGGTKEVVERMLVQHEPASQVYALCKTRSFWKEQMKHVGIADPTNPTDKKRYDEFLEALLAQRQPNIEGQVKAKLPAWLMGDNVVMPAFGPEVEQECSYVDLHQRLVKAVRHRYILALSVYASLRWPAMPSYVRYNCGGGEILSRTELLQRPDKFAETHAAAVAAIQQAKKKGATPTAPGLGGLQLYDKSVPVGQRLSQALQRVLEILKPELLPDNLNDIGNVALQETVLDTLGSDHPLFKAQWDRVAHDRWRIQLGEIVRKSLASRAGKPAGGGYYLTATSVMSLLLFCQQIYGDSHPHEAAKFLMAILTQDFKQEMTYTAWEGTYKELQGNNEPVLVPLIRAHYLHLHENRKGPLVAPAADPTAQRPTAPQQEVMEEEEAAGVVPAHLLKLFSVGN
jgi:hypothetical protein